MKKLNILIGILYCNTVGLVFITINLVRNILSTVGVPNQNIENSFSTIFLIWLCIYILFVVINIVSVVMDFRQNKIDMIYQKMKRIKIGLIPYWIINFICYFPICILFLLVGHGFGFIIVPIFIFSSYTVLLVTSLFSILLLICLIKLNILNNGNFIKHVICQLIFVLDIIDSFIIIKIYKKQSEEKKNTA